MVRVFNCLSIVGPTNLIELGVCKFILKVGPTYSMKLMGYPLMFSGAHICEKLNGYLLMFVGPTCV